MNEQLILLPEHVEFCAVKIDALVKSKNVIIEALDYPAAKLVVNYLNKVASPHVPDEYKPKIQEALTDVLNSDYGEAVNDALAAVDEVIQDIQSLKPGVKELVSALLQMVAAALASLINKPEQSEA